MFRLTLKNIWAYKTRLALSMLSIVLGVAFLVGTLVISATLNQTFDDLFASVFKSTDAVVRSSQTIDASFGEFEQRDNVPQTLVEDVLAVEGVKRAEGNIQINNVIALDQNGDRLFSGGGGPPVLGFKWDRDDILSSWRLVSENGDSLSAKETVAFEIPDNSLLVDKSTSEAKDLEVGGKVRIVTPTGPVDFTVAGLVRFGTSDGAAGAPSFLFNEKQAFELAQQGNTYQSVSVVADDGISQEEIKTKLKAELSKNQDFPVQVVTGEEITEENQSAIKEALGFFTQALTFFALISFLTAFVIIVNSFAIIMTQRKQEYALLRAVGAKASQIRRSVALESFFVGLVASVIGVAAGIGVSTLIKSGLGALGLELPSGPLVVSSSAVITGIALGTLATVASAFIPAFSASRVPPIEALRETAFEKQKKWWPRASLSALAGIACGVTLFLGFTDRTDSKIQTTAIGIALGFAFLILALPFLVRPFTALIGSRPAGIALLPFGGRHAFGIDGVIARRNNYRNPRRTSRTALALVIGVALVAFVTVFASSVNATIDNYLKQNFVGDFIVSSDNFEPIITPAQCDEIALQNFVDVSSCFKSASGAWAAGATTLGVKNVGSTFVSGIDSDSITKLYATPFTGEINNLGGDGTVLSKQFAESNDLSLGDSIAIRLDSGEQEFVVKGIIEQGIPFDFATVMIDNVAYDQLSSIKTSTSAIINLVDGASVSESEEALKGIFKNTGLSVNDQTAIREQSASQINQLLSLIYALLGLAIVIASIGIINTMSLSILERKRELGLMRAVGALNSQVRGFIRFESVIVAVMGTVIGMVFGVAGAFALVKALADDGFDQFSLGAPALIAIVFLSAFIGVIAGAWPAWRATKVDVLKSITVE